MATVLVVIVFLEERLLFRLVTFNVGRSEMRHRVPARSSPSGAVPRVSPTVVFCLVNGTHYGHKSKQFPLVKPNLKNGVKLERKERKKKRNVDLLISCG